MGVRAEVEGYRLAPGIRVHWLADGDHSLEPRRRSGRSLDENLDEAADQAAGFVKAVLAATPG